MSAYLPSGLYSSHGSPEFSMRKRRPAYLRRRRKRRRRRRGRRSRRDMRKQEEERKGRLLYQKRNPRM